MSQQRILSFGSLNIDRVYSVNHIVAPGETISSNSYQEFVGGKGLNQSIALSRSGAQVYHAGAVGQDGDFLLATLEAEEIQTQDIKRTPDKSGHAVIQVDAQGQNSIILFPGANFAIEQADIDRVLSNFVAGDYLLIQNEISEIDYLIRQAHAKGLTIFFNPSPFQAKLLEMALDQVDWFLVNEIEAQQLAQVAEFDLDTICRSLEVQFPQASFVITLGSAGSVCLHQREKYHQSIYATTAVDTTAAGDTFTGYFIANLLHEGEIPKALEIASRAASITVSRMGAAASIPYLHEIEGNKEGERQDNICSK